MNNKIFILDDAPEYIYLTDSGSIVHQSIFEKNFDGDLKLLLSCVEDNIVASGDRWHEGDNDEPINWNGVFADYRAALELSDYRNSTHSRHMSNQLEVFRVLFEFQQKRNHETKIE